jgi:hypothetical protein
VGILSARQSDTVDKFMFLHDSKFARLYNSTCVLWYKNILYRRLHHHDSTASRSLCEVKHGRARLVLRWGTTLESRVLFFLSFGLSTGLDYLCETRILSITHSQQQPLSKLPVLSFLPCGGGYYRQCCGGGSWAYYLHVRPG